MSTKRNMQVEKENSGIKRGFKIENNRRTRRWTSKIPNAGTLSL